MSSFPAKYPGSCTCGASFKAGARIYWDGSIRRATGCPACAPRKAIPGVTRRLPSGLSVRFDTHPDTGAVVLAAFSDPCGAWNAYEVYRLDSAGRWCLSQCGREAIFSRPLSHEQVQGMLEAGEQASISAAA
jgi:hypothetical protein